MKKLLRFFLKLVFFILLLAVAFICWLTAREYNPAPLEEVSVSGQAAKQIPAGSEISILSWNVGYAALGKEADFAMDGGGNVPPADEPMVKRYLSGISQTAGELAADIRIYQEVDVNSKRSYSQDERSSLAMSNGAFAYNYRCDFVPFPMPPWQRVESGLYSATDYEIDRAERISLPCPFSWPLRVANLKRCLLASYLPIENSDKQLVLVNLHLEAYDSGEGKIAQTKQLSEFIQAEYSRGNYVIAGGDWNQVFPGTLDSYPNKHSDLWSVGSLDENLLPDGWKIAFDEDTPTCRLLNQPYVPSDTANTQYYVIDGFVLSPNVQFNSVQTVDKGFENSDHNPVLLNVTLE